MSQKTYLLLGVALAALLSGGQARAAGFELREQSAVAQGSALAGATARGDDPSFMFFNPAAMGWLQGTDVSIVGSGILPQGRLNGASASRSSLLGGSAITGSQGNDALVDAFLPAGYVSTGLTDTIRIGLGLTTPFGLTTKYPSDFIGRYHALTSNLRTVDITPTISWRPVESVSLGAALIIETASARLSNAVDGTGALLSRGVPPSFASALGRDFRSTLAGDSTSVGVQLGAQWEPVAGTRLGLSWRSAITHELSGTASFDGVPSALASTFTNTHASAKLTTPDIISLGASQKVTPELTLLAQAEWTNWSRFRDLTVLSSNGLPPSVTNERWRDSYFISGGAEYQLTPDLALRSGVAWDQTPVRDQYRTPRIPDGDRIWLSAGASYRVMQNVTLTAAYTHILVDETKVNLAANSGNSSDLLRGNLGGTYRGSVDILSAAVRVQF